MPHVGERYHNGRFGVGVTHEGGHPAQYDVGLLNAGWYWDWTARITPTLAHLDYVHTVRLSPTEVGYKTRPDRTTILKAAAAHPGAMWFIGNEPDCVWQDNMRSDIYAQAYHDLYSTIKAADPTAKIGAGSIVQPTPQRLRYLDRVLETYQQMYDEPLPADFWATHSYILCENCFPQRPGDPFAWGACPVPDWPEGSEDAVYYSVYDHWRLDIFRERIVDFRQWMYDRGYRDCPLIVSEYGILFYDGLVEGRTVEDNVAFMTGTFDWMREARDPYLGYPPDDNRLVQRWAWYSLAHDGWYVDGSLFDYSTHEPLDLGLAYGAYTAALTPTVDLLVWGWAEPVRSVQGELVTATLRARISNAGDVRTTEPLSVTFLVGESGMSIGGLATRPLDGWGDWVEVSQSWVGLGEGEHLFCVRAAAAAEEAAVEEATACNVVLVDPQTVYLPLVMQDWAGQPGK